MRALHSVCIDNSVMDDTEPSPIRKEHLKPGQAGNGVFALNHG
jgi:hypothetical protein